MKPILFIILTMTILFESCRKTDTGNVPIIKNGTYTGTFQRQVSGNGIISNVTIIFSSANWSGESQYTKYPALCRGTYKINAAQQITFENSCFWTAEFDWTLILSGDYKLIADGNNIEIFKDYNGVFKDVYKLVRQ
jgi:hypothetical protein